MLAVAVLTIAAAESARCPAPAGQIPLTRNGIAHMISNLTSSRRHDARHRTHWSKWRRCHQHRARTCHYQQQLALESGT
jgi:hypothetical protein